MTHVTLTWLPGDDTTGIPTTIPSTQKSDIMDSRSIAAQMNADLAIGWWIWTSPNNVEHLVQGNGKCATCGRNHTKETS